MESLVVIFVILLQLYIAIAASFGKFKKDNDDPYPLNLTFWGWSLMVSCIMCFGCSLYLYFLNKDSQAVFEMKLAERDSVAEVKRSQGNVKLMRALAEYHLQYSDSLQSVIKIVRDSAKGITNILNEVEPSFKLDIPPITLDSSNENIRFFSINLRVFKGEVYNARVDFEVVKFSANKFSLYRKDNLVGISNGRFTEGTQTSIPTVVFSSPGAILFFYVFGGFTNSSGTKRFSINEICAFDMNDFMPHMPTAQSDSDVRKFLKDNHLLVK